MIVFWGLGALCLASFLAMAAYVRLAPSDPARWHVAPRGDSDKRFANGVLRHVAAGPDGLQRLHAVIVGDRRSTVLAGSPEAGMITYVSRTRLMGYPDYTTVMRSGDDLVIYARSRFGRKDLGVNAARVAGWIEALALE